MKLTTMSQRLITALVGILMLTTLFLPRSARAQVQLQVDAITSGATVSASGSAVTLQGSIGQIATSGSESSVMQSFSGIWSALYSGEVNTDIEKTDPPSSNLPENFNLEPAYPNPFNPRTKIRYALPEAAHVKLAVYNMLGKQIRVLVNQRQKAGRYTISFRARDLSSGIYLYRLQAGAFTGERKMTLVK